MTSCGLIIYHFSWLDWSADANSAVYAEGTVNDASDRDESWTVEMALSFKALAARSNKMSRKTPDDGETWFMNFGRSEQSLIVTDKDTYVKDESVPTSWRSWQPCGAINLHLQDRWGLVQFRKTTNEPFYFRDWHVFRAAFDVMDAEKKQKTLNAHYTDNLAELDMPPYLMTGVCVDIPKIKVTRNGQEDFLATVTSKLYKNLTMQIRPDRYVTRAITDCKVKK